MSNLGPSSSSQQNPILLAAVPAAAGTILVSNGPTSAPSFQTIAAGFANTNNGQTIRMSPQDATGVNASMGTTGIDFGAANFTGNFSVDPVTTIGYNSTIASIFDATKDPFSNVLQLEANYEHSVDNGTATAATSTTTLNDSGKTWPVNGFTGWTLYNSTRGISQKITANTATSITSAAITGQVSGDSYQVLRCDAEQFLSLSAANGATSRGVRPLFFSIDRASAIDKLNVLTVNAATAANPMVITVSGGHRFTSATYSQTPWVRFASMPGSYAAVNDKQYQVTVISSTTFSVPVDSSGFGAYTSGGTAQLEPVIVSASLLMAPTSGLTLNLPSWSGSSSDVMFWFRPGDLQINAPPGNSQTPNLALNAQVGVFQSTLFMGANGQLQNVWTGRQGSMDFSTTDTAGANQRLAISIWRGASGGGTTGAIQVGLNSLTQPLGLITANNTDANGNAANPLLYAKKNGSQTGEPLRIDDSSANRQWFVDASQNTVTRVTATALADTNGFLWIPRYAGKPTGVPTGTGNFANSSPLVYDTTNKKLSVYDFLSTAWLQTAAMT